MKYLAEISPLMKQINHVMMAECECVDCCLIQHSRNVVVEVRKYDIDNVVATLRKHFPNVVDIRKAYSMIEYLHDFILVKPGITEAPVYEAEEVIVPTLEKLLVDSIADKDYVCEVSCEPLGLFQSAFEQYDVNTSRLVRYASRKGKKDEVNDILSRIDQDRVRSVKAICEVLSSSPVLSAWIFGSFARREERPDSDIDLLVSLDKATPVGLMGLSDLCQRLEAAAGRRVDLVPDASLKPFARDSVEKDKILVYERGR